MKTRANQDELFLWKCLIRCQQRGKQWRLWPPNKSAHIFVKIELFDILSKARRIPIKQFDFWDNSELYSRCHKKCGLNKKPEIPKRSTDVQFFDFPISAIAVCLLVCKNLCRQICLKFIAARWKILQMSGLEASVTDPRGLLELSPSLNTSQSQSAKKARNLITVILFFYLLVVQWGPCAYVIVHTILPPKPVSLRIGLGVKPKWLPLNFGYHDVMRTSPIGSYERTWPSTASS